MRAVRVVLAALLATTSIPMAGIAAPRIEEAAFARLGGIEQWITLRGDDADNPVLLVVHGGPGDTLSPYLREFRPYEAEFVVVHWDQRGAGRTFGRNGAATPDITLDKIVEDGLELANTLRARFGRSVVLFGHSWGSVVGVEMVRRRPELFDSYVGTGQVAGWAAGAEARYRFLKAAAAEPDAAALRAALHGVGTFDPNDPGDFQILNREIRARLGAADASWLSSQRAREVSTPQEFSDARAGMTLSGRALLADMLSENLFATASRLDVPVIVVQGKEDLFTPTDPAAAWLDALKAPRKELIVIEGAGHFALLTHSAEVILALKAAVADIP